MKRALLLTLVLAAACGAPGPGAPAPAADGPPRVILFIGDGAGLDYWSAAKAAASAPLAIEEFPVVGLVDTEAFGSRITDSAAGATAYATGIRTFNGAIGVGPDSSPATTVLEVAEDQGWATGLVATSTVTHATPASFAAHVVSRNLHREIAQQMAEQDIDVLLGGGRSYFRGDAEMIGNGQGAEDLIPRLTRGAAYVEDAAALRALDLDTVSALVGLFAETQPGPALQRSPSLPQLTRAALEVLEDDEDGFFLMVEGSQIDWRGHENASIGAVLAEVQDLDRAVRAALRFQQAHPNTLILVTADHSTGGFALHPDDAGVLRAHYTTESHTLGMVPLFARGPHAPAFAGIMDNDRVGRLLLEIVRHGRTSSERER